MTLNVTMLHLKITFAQNSHNMTETHAIQTLRQVGLKQTPLRIAILQELTTNMQALSQPDLENVFEGRENRVTIYRVLRDLEEKGVIHRVFDLNGTARFAICRNGCTAHVHNDEHVHFNCTACKNVFCLNDIVVAAPSLPTGFTFQTVKLTVEGICKNCSVN